VHDAEILFRTSAFSHSQDPPRPDLASSNSGQHHETQGSIVAMVGEGAGRLHCRALTLPRSRLTELGMRRQSHPHDPTQGQARLQKTMAKKCLDNGQYVERLRDLNSNEALPQTDEACILSIT
jgi:hypothetical protein